MSEQAKKEGNIDKAFVCGWSQSSLFCMQSFFIFHVSTKIFFSSIFLKLFILLLWTMGNFNSRAISSEVWQLKKSYYGFISSKIMSVLFQRITLYVTLSILSCNFYSYSKRSLTLTYISRCNFRKTSRKNLIVLQILCLCNHLYS